jgi:hypothetical protein
MGGYQIPPLDATCYFLIGIMAGVRVSALLTLMLEVEGVLVLTVVVNFLSCGNV